MMDLSRSEEGGFWRTAVKQATESIQVHRKRVKERAETETLGRAGRFLCERLDSWDGVARPQLLTAIH